MELISKENINIFIRDQEEIIKQRIKILNNELPNERIQSYWGKVRFAIQILCKELHEEAKKKIDDLQAKKDDYAKNFGEKIEEVKKYMSEVFGSKFLLPGMWAALLPSMTPYLGGIIPPPFFIGPPSTIPGMIYLVLLMGDAYDALEEEVEEEAEKTWQEKCAEQL